MDCPGPSQASQRGEKRRSGGTTLAEKAFKFIMIDGEKAICSMDPGSGCTYIQRKLDVNNFVRHFRTRHTEKADSEGMVKEVDPVARKPRFVAKRPVAIDKRVIVEVAIKLVSFHNLPVSCFQWEGMRQLFEPVLAAVGMTLDTRKLKCHVAVAAGLIKDAIAEEMKGMLVSLKIDSASRHNRHVLAILARYAIDGVIVSRTLGVIEVKESQTATFLKDQIMAVIQSYGLSIDQIFSVTCDNGANMLAAVRHLKHEFEAYCIFTVEDAGHENDKHIDIETENEQQQELLTAALSDKLQENLNLIRCAVHTLQLAILDVVNKSDEQVKKMTGIAKKCRSVKYTKFFELHRAKYPPIWGQTRWGGIYEMVSTFLEQRPFFEKLAEQSQDLDLTDSWQFATNYEQAFKPLFLLTKDMQAEHVSLSDFYLQWLIATKKVELTKPNPFADELVASMNLRLQNLKQSRAFKIAVYLDPRLNYAGSTLFNHEEKAEIQDYIIETWNRIKELQTPDLKTSENTPTSGSSQNEADMFITELFGHSTVTSTGNDGGFMQQLKAVEVEPRRSVNFDVWRFWADRKATHPELSAVAAVVLATPSNQVSVERGFSALSLILTNVRATIGEDTLHNLLIVKLNKELFNKISPKLVNLNEESDGQRLVSTSP